LEIIGSWTFCEQRLLHGSSTVLMGLDEACKDGV